MLIFAPSFYRTSLVPFSMVSSILAPSVAAPLTSELVMELAVLLAAGLQDWIDFGVIIAILLLNATVGWYQEKQAADVVASLKGDIAMRSTVVRDGAEQDIKARELVPGDIVRHWFVAHAIHTYYR